MTGWVDGSWHKLRDWASREANVIRAEARLIMARADCLQLAIERSEDIAAGQIVRDFHELDLREVIADIFDVLRQCLIVMITSTGGGALLGGIAGGIGGAGVGAIPGVAVGAAAGAQVGEWILIVMGLRALSEYIVRDMPAIARNYRDGLRQAWLAASPPALPQHQVRVDAFALQNAAATLARGHVAMFVLLLMGIVAYLAKGRGNIGELAENVRGSKLGARFSEWMVRNEGRLKAEPRLGARVDKSSPETKEPATVARKSRPHRPQPSVERGAGNKVLINPKITAAQNDQLGAGYNADTWNMTTLPKGSRVYGGLPGQSPYYTTQKAILDSGRNSTKLFRSLQVAPHPVFGYRPEVGIYQVLEDIEVPAGQALANPSFGPGGARQFFIDNYGTKLKPVGRMQLWN